MKSAERDAPNDSNLYSLYISFSTCISKADIDNAAAPSEAATPPLVHGVIGPAA